MKKLSAPGVSRRTVLALPLTATLRPGIATAQAAYPSRPITIVLPYAAGSGSDQWARAVSQVITRDFKLPVIVDNKPGANGFIAAQQVAKAAADGYTVLMGSSMTHGANAHMFRKLPYDPVADFTPVTLVYKGYMVLLVNAASPAKSVADLVGIAKASPGKLSFGSGTGASRIAAEMFRQHVGIQVTNVPYKSTPPALNDLIGGQTDFVFSDMVTGRAALASGKVRALAVTSARRLSEMADLPTLQESGLKGYEWSLWAALYLPKGATAALTTRVNDVFRKAIAAPEIHAFATTNSLELVPGTGEELARFQAQESDKIGRVVRQAGIEAE